MRTVEEAKQQVKENKELDKLMNRIKSDILATTELGKYKTTILLKDNEVKFNNYVNVILNENGFKVKTPYVKDNDNSLVALTVDWSNIECSDEVKHSKKFITAEEAFIASELNVDSFMAYQFVKNLFTSFYERALFGKYSYCLEEIHLSEWSIFSEETKELVTRELKELGFEFVSDGELLFEISWGNASIGDAQKLKEVADNLTNTIIEYAMKCIDSMIQEQIDKNNYCLPLQRGLLRVFSNHNADVEGFILEHIESKGFTIDYDETEKYIFISWVDE